MGYVKLVNILFCAAILIIGLYGKGRTKLAMNIGIAFGIFGLSHLLVALGIGHSLLIMTVRTIAYLFIIVALVKTK